MKTLNGRSHRTGSFRKNDDGITLSDFFFQFLGFFFQIFRSRIKSSHLNGFSEKFRLQNTVVDHKNQSFVEHPHRRRIELRCMIGNDDFGRIQIQIFLSDFSHRNERCSIHQYPEIFLHHGMKYTEFFLRRNDW